MEANYEQRGFTSNGKLVMSLYQASNPSSSTVHDVRLVIPNQSSSVASVSRYSDAQSIDAKAASYISTVRQRFTLEWSEQTTSLSCRDGVASDYTSVLIYSIMYAVFSTFFFSSSLLTKERLNWTWVLYREYWRCQHFNQDLLIRLWYPMLSL